MRLGATRGPLTSLTQRHHDAWRQPHLAKPKARTRWCKTCSSETVVTSSSPLARGSRSTTLTIGGERTGEGSGRGRRGHTPFVVAIETSDDVCRYTLACRW
jgi:hypothetical protein